MGGLFGGKKDSGAAAAAAAKQAAEEEKKRKEEEQKKKEREQAYGARGQRLSQSLGQDSAYTKDAGGKAAEEEKSTKLGNTAMNYNLLNVKLG